MPSSRAGRAVSSSIACGRPIVAVMHLRQRHRQQRRQPDAAGRGLGERQALVVGVARLVVGGDRVDRAVRQARQPPPGDRCPCATAATAWRRCENRRSRSRSGRNTAARCRRSPPAPSSLARRISSSASAVETCAKCTAPPVSRARLMSRATRIASAAAGMPGRPSRVGQFALGRARRRRRATDPPGAARCGRRSRGRRTAPAASAGRTR